MAVKLFRKNGKLLTKNGKLLSRVVPDVPEYFAFTIDTSLGTGASFDLPLQQYLNVYDNDYNIISQTALNYDFIVDWGDGNENQITSWNDVNKQHNYATDGEYQIKISGIMQGWGFIDNIQDYNYNSEDAAKVVSVDETGNTGLMTLEFGFNECNNLVGWSETNSNFTSSVTNMISMFYYAESFNQPLNFDTSAVTNMSYMFLSATSFNQPLNFDTSSVTNMVEMFSYATSFNQPLTFDTSAVTNMSYMFLSATSFNQPLNFDTSSVTDMSGMFYYAESFNQPLNFDTSSVTDMSGMFLYAESFNQPLNFDTSAVTNMSSMFYYATSFNQDLSGWCVSLIGTKPSNFDTNTTAWVKTNRQPIWGTCP